MPLNLSKYLERLGIQSQGQQPFLLDTIQPVVICQDLSLLVSSPLQCSYVVGAANVPAAGNIACGLVVTPVPLLIDFYLSSPGNNTVAFQIGSSFAINNVTILVPQLFTPRRPAQAVWSVGDLIAAPSLFLPTISCAVTGPLPIYRFRVPAGNACLFQFSTAAVAMRWAAVVSELPDDLTP